MHRKKPSSAWLWPHGYVNEYTAKTHPERIRDKTRSSNLLDPETLWLYSRAFFGPVVPLISSIFFSLKLRMEISEVYNVYIKLQLSNPKIKKTIFILELKKTTHINALFFSDFLKYLREYYQQRDIILQLT